MYESVDIGYDGIRFEVSGEWEPFQPATWLEPSEGGHFTEWDVKIDGVSIYELLKDEIAEMLVRSAEEEIRGMK